MNILPFVLGAVVGWGMMRTPLQGEDGMVAGLVIGLVCVFMVCVMWKRYGRRGMIGPVAVGVLGVIVEYVGITTCWPYGCFEYSSLVGPKFLGTFPYALLAIRPLFVMSIVQFVPRVIGNRGVAAFLGGSFLSLFDMILDPVAVAQGIWGYADARWYGVPLTNMLGRVITGTISCRLLLKLSPILRGDPLLRRAGRFITGMYGMAFLVVIGLVPVV